MYAQKHLYILVTKYSDRFSRVIAAIIQNHYTHVSIGLCEQDDHYYSFTRRGFRTEVPDKICRSKENVECVLFKVPVSEQSYSKMKCILSEYLDEPGRWKYNLFGVFCGIVRFPYFRTQYKRFCSQFVAEALEQCAVVSLDKKSTVFFPDDFLRLNTLTPVYLGTLEGLPKADGRLDGSKVSGIASILAMRSARRFPSYRRQRPLVSFDLIGLDSFAEDA